MFSFSYLKLFVIDFFDASKVYTGSAWELVALKPILAKFKQRLQEFLFRKANS